MHERTTIYNPTKGRLKQAVRTVSIGNAQVSIEEISTNYLTFRFLQHQNQAKAKPAATKTKTTTGSNNSNNNKNNNKNTAQAVAVRTDLLTVAVFIRVSAQGPVVQKRLSSNQVLTF